MSILLVAVTASCAWSIRLRRPAVSSRLDTVPVQHWSPKLCHHGSPTPLLPRARMDIVLTLYRMRQANVICIEMLWQLPIERAVQWGGVGKEGWGGAPCRATPGTPGQGLVTGNRDNNTRGSPIVVLPVRRSGWGGFDSFCVGYGFHHEINTYIFTTQDVNSVNGQSQTPLFGISNISCGSL